MAHNFSCPSCNKSTLIHKDNALIHIHPTMPEYNFLELFCNCGQKWSVFRVESMFGELYEAGVYTTTHQEVAPIVQKAYRSLYANEDDIVAYFHRILLETGGVDEIRWDEHI